MNETFVLHPQLEKDSVPITKWTLCDVRLMNDRRFPWLLLIPRRPNLRDLHDANDSDYRVLTDEIREASRLLKEETRADKMNVASLGNMVPQLHIHVIARFEEDEAWPGPVWGIGTPQAYTENELAAEVHRYTELYEG